VIVSEDCKEKEENIREWGQNQKSTEKKATETKAGGKQKGIRYADQQKKKKKRGKKRNESAKVGAVRGLGGLHGRFGGIKSATGN